MVSSHCVPPHGGRNGYNQQQLKRLIGQLFSKHRNFEILSGISAKKTLKSAKNRNLPLSSVNAKLTEKIAKPRKYAVNCGKLP